LLPALPLIIADVYRGSNTLEKNDKRWCLLPVADLADGDEDEDEDVFGAKTASTQDASPKTASVQMPIERAKVRAVRAEQPVVHSDGQQ
jgi:hypothetical protein